MTYTLLCGLAPACLPPSLYFTTTLKIDQEQTLQHSKHEIRSKGCPERWLLPNFGSSFTLETWWSLNLCILQKLWKFLFFTNVFGQSGIGRDMVTSILLTLQAFGMIGQWFPNFVTTATNLVFCTGLWPDAHCHATKQYWDPLHWTLQASECIVEENWKSQVQIRSYFWVLL